MKRLLGILSVALLASMFTASAFAATPAQEMLTPENMEKWQSGVKQRSRSALTFDKEKRQVHFNTFDDKGHGNFYLGDDQYGDFRIDCVVSFSKVYGKYGGLSLYLRDADSNRYWVYWRPNNRGLYAIKIRSNSKPISEYDAGKKQADRPNPTEMNQDYTFSVEMRGRRLRAFLDGKQMVEFVDPLPEMYARGRIGLFGASCDAAIKSIKITDLNETGKLAVKSYKYINPPEKGDTTGTLLTDGKINGKDEQALWWLATKGDPIMVFDLGQTYFINGVKLKALAPPNANISAYRILGSSDGEKWQVLAGEVNNSTDSREQTQVLQTKFSSLARYVKVMLFRQAGDATIKLDEVEIMGRTARPEDKAAVAAPKTYYTGATIPPVTLRGKTDEHWFYLEGGGLRVAVNRKVGNLGPVHNVAQKQRCTMVSYDAYYVETRKSEQEFSEENNQVVNVSDKDGVLTLTCRNKNVKDVDIIQIYKTTADGISKTTELVNRGSLKDLFVTVKTGAILDQSFREDGWYLGADRGLGGRLKAAEVTLPMTATCHSPKNTKVVVFMNYGKKFGISQYRYAMNGEYCEPVTSRYFEKSNHPPLYTPNGWKLGLLTLHLEPNKPRSVEVRWNLFPEEEFFFLKQYTSIPEVNKLFNIARPDWLLRLKSIPSAMSGFPSGHGANKDMYMRWTQRSYDLYDDGYIYMLHCGDDVWGDWYQGGPYAIGWCGEKKDNAYLRRLFDDMRKQMPRLKLALYTWAWTGWDYSKSYLNHPDWYIVRNKHGYVTKGYQNGPMNYVRRISAPGNMEDLLASAEKMFAHYDTDFFYLDGGGGGNNLIDWERLTLDYDVDWQRFHWGLNKVCRQVSERERVFFTNSRSEPYVDIGFYEGINNRLNATAWRESGDALLALKMRNSLFPKMTFIPIYWRTNNIPFYSNYCIGLGLVPENIYSSRELRNVAYVTAAYETRMFKFVPANLAPDWRTDMNVELEAYTLTHAPAAILSLINHSNLPVSQTVSADAARLGIDTGKPIFSWLIRMNDAREKQSGMSEGTAKEVYQKSGWGVDLAAAPVFRGIVQADKGRLGLTEKFDLNVLNMATFSNCPAIVYATNGRRRQIWQPNSRGITVNGGIDLPSRTIVLHTESNITADVTTAELLVYVPNDWQDFQVSGATLKRQLFLDKQRFLLLRVNGFGKVSVTAKRTAPYNVLQTEKLALGKVTAPGTISLNLPDGERFITVYHKGVPVFFGDADQLQLPKELASGKYQVSAVVGDIAYTGEFAVESAWTYAFPEIKPKRTSAQLAETVVNRTVKGIKILKSAVTSHDGYRYPLFTQVEPDNLTFAAGSEDFATSRYGYAMAGLEIEQLKVVQLEVKNTFFRAWSNYDRQTWKPGHPHAFVGLIVDYHTPQGYAKRVALGMGLLQRNSDAIPPRYGKKAKADAFVRLKDYISLSKEAKLSLNLATWAPKGWDGRVWISAATNGGVYAGRRLYVTILGNADDGGKIPFDQGELLTNELKQPTLTVPKIATPIKIDGKLDDAAWSKAVASDVFKLTTSMRAPSQKTEMVVCQDDKNLYLGVKNHETERAHLMSDGEKLWAHDAMDISFAPLPLPKIKTFHKFVIDHENRTYQETRPLTRKREKWQVRSATRQVKGAWVFEIAIPLKYLKLKNGEIAFNLLRYRPSSTGMEACSWGLIPLEDYMEPKYFGSLKF